MTLFLLLILLNKQISSQSDYFDRVFDYSLFPVNYKFTNYTITTNKTKYECLYECLRLTSCAYVTYNHENYCSFFNKYSIKQNSSSLKTYRRQGSSDLSDLSFYWPFFEGVISDFINGKNLITIRAITHVRDRFNNTRSAIGLSSNYLKIPLENFFQGDFTIMLWYRKFSTTNFQRIIECGSREDDSILMSAAYSNVQTTFFKIYDTMNDLNDTAKSVIGKTPIVLNIWYHLTFVLQGSNGYIYVNGILDGQGDLNFPKNIFRSSCHLGGSLKANILATAIFDDLKIFNRALSINEIINEYEIN